MNLFNGDYKLVRVGNAPWERPSNDTIRITVKGNTIQDIPVTPYFFIKDVSFTKSNNKIVAKFTVNKVIANANMEDVSLYLGKGILKITIKRSDVEFRKQDSSRTRDQR